MPVNRVLEHDSWYLAGTRW